MNLPESISENRALALLRPEDLKIYSAGISTAGLGEVLMARANPNRTIVATTIDAEGASFTQDFVTSRGCTEQVEVRIEDLRKPLPRADEYFDVVHSRLALHYLPPSELDSALGELRRILRVGGRFFCVVRSVDGLGGEGRHLHSNQSITRHVTNAGFAINTCTDYEELLYADYQRSHSPNTDHVIEITANRP